MSTSSAIEGAAVGTRTNLPTDIVPLRHRGRLALAVIVLFAAVVLVYSVVRNDNFEWHVVGDYLFNDAILVGLRTTVLLTVISMSLGIVLGVVLAVCRMSENKVLKTLAGVYLWFFRGTPLLVQLVFWYNLSSLYPRLSLGIPFGGPEFFGAATNHVLSLWPVAIVGLTLNESAYMAEIVRGGLLSVPRHQSEAASALGMNSPQTFLRIILPQALRVIVPPTGNQVIGMLKSTSLVSIIALADLLYSAQLIYSQSFQPIPLLLVASIWYLVCTTVLSVAQSRIERHYGRGAHGNIVRPPARWSTRALVKRYTARRAWPTDGSTDPGTAKA